MHLSGFHCTACAINEQELTVGPRNEQNFSEGEEHYGHFPGVSLDEQNNVQTGLKILSLMLYKIIGKNSFD
jgi:hypothetical protein